ncbi:MAG: hypothetical protein ACOCWW_02150 [Bacteroidota bacterium]
MTQLKFEELLLQTAFSCMACDGEIDKREIELIKSLEKDEQLFELENIESLLNELIEEINKKGHGFLRDYLNQVNQASLTEEQEIKLVRTAIRTIEADEKVEYSEIKFFKIIRPKLAVSDKTLKENLSDIENIEEYLEQDIISESYMEKMTAEYFDKQNLPEFKPINLNE